MTKSPEPWGTSMSRARGQAPLQPRLVKQTKVVTEAFSLELLVIFYSLLFCSKAIMNAATAFRGQLLPRLRAVPFQASSLPRIVRNYSAASGHHAYKYIEVSEPRPGVGQGKLCCICISDMLAQPVSMASRHPIPAHSPLNITSPSPSFPPTNTPQ